MVLIVLFIVLCVMINSSFSFKAIGKAGAKRFIVDKPRKMMQFNYEYEHGVSTTASLTSFVSGFGDAEKYVIFYAPWCPDCRAVPYILASLQEQSEMRSPQKDIVVVMADIGQKDVWKSGTEHAFKQPELNLKGIPTLMKWSADGSEEGRLEGGLTDGSAMRRGEEHLKSLVANFVNK